MDTKQTKVLVPLAFSAWAGISTKPYVTVASFEDESRGLTFTDVDNGVYTFLITQIEAGTKKAYTQYAVVHEGTTEKAAAETELDRYLKLAEETLAKGKRGVDEAAYGESYVPVAYYDKLKDAIDHAKEMQTTLAQENTLDTYDDLIPEMISLHSAIISFENKLVTRPLTDETELVIDTTDYTQVKISKSDLVRASIAYGSYSTWAKFSKSGYVTIQAKDDVNKVVIYTDAQYNGTYTALCTYSDGTAVFKTFEIDSIQYPFTVSQQDGKITIDLQELETTSLGFGYGDLTNKEDSAFITINKEDGTSQYEVPALGNGEHTVMVKTADHTYYQTIDVDSCTGPVIVKYNGKIGIFTHGFEYRYVAYKTFTESGYSDWEEMYKDASYCGQNQWYETSAFPAGNYTFYFKADTAENSVFKDVTM